jgi:hypothetical protein
MRKLLVLTISICLACAAFSQTKIQVKNDTVKVINGELVINNNSKNTPGYLYNVGSGVTQFKPIDSYVDSVWASNDTIYYRKGISTSYILLSTGALTDPGSNGMLSRTGSNTLTTRTLSGTTGNIVVTNGDGVSGNPTFDVGNNVATLTGSQTLTGKSISGSSNTISNIGNSSLTNSSISLAVGTSTTTPNWSSSSVALGSTATLNLPDYRPKSAFVTSDVTTTSTTVSNVTGLSLGVDANKTYKLHANLIINSGGTGGLVFTVTAPSGSTLKSLLFHGSNTTTNNMEILRISSFGTVSGTFLTAAANNGRVIIDGYFTTGGTSGNINIQFASGTSGQTSTIVTGSGFDLQELQ